MNGTIALDHRIKFSEKVFDEEYCTTTFYFTAPKELLSHDAHDADSFLISVEFPTNNPEAKHALVEYCPLIKGEPVGWIDLSLPYDEIESLISLGEGREEDKKPSLLDQISGATQRAGESFSRCEQTGHDSPGGR